jgi:hypothetical protein
VNKGAKIEVFRIIHRVFHSFAHKRKGGVENFLEFKIPSNPFDKCRFLWYNWVKRKAKRADGCGLVAVNNFLRNQGLGGT